MDTKIFLSGFCIVVLYKIIINLIRFIKIRRFYDKYICWLANEPINLDENLHEIVELWRGAGIEDTRIPFAQPAGFGMISTGSAPAFRNFPNNQSNIVPIFVGMFNQAIGIYKRRMWQAVNPFYWIEFILYLPKHILSYLDIASESLLLKISQLIYWVLGVIFTASLSLYPIEFRAVLDKILSFLKT